MSTLTLVVVGKDWDSLRDFQLEHVCGADLVLVANEDGTALSKLANRWLDRAQTPIFGLCHADCGFGPRALAAFIAEAERGSVCGIVGIDEFANYRWSTAGAARVSTLDSCSVFFRRDFGLRFDEATFDGFHCHVEDLCLQAQARGIRSTVPAARASHRSRTENGDAWLAQYWSYRARLANKWSGVEFRTT